MVINVYKSDFSVFPGLYNSVVEARHDIIVRAKNFVTVDFGKAAWLNPYVDCERIAKNERYSYRDVLYFVGQLDSKLLDQARTLLDSMEYSTDKIVRIINTALAYPEYHVNHILF